MLSKNKIKYITSLNQKKNRDDLGLYLIEGDKTTVALLQQNPSLIDEIFVTNAWVNKNKNLLQGLPYTVCEPHDIEKASGLNSAPQIMVIVKKTTLPDLLINDTSFTLVLDNIQDPGNLGTIIRTADWFGIKNIVCNTETVDCYNPKTIQSAMGSLWNVNVYYNNIELLLTNTKDINIYAAVLDGVDLKTMTKIKPGIIIIGNEGKGIQDKLLTKVTHKITITGNGNAESLNAAVATGIILSHIV